MKRQRKQRKREYGIGDFLDYVTGPKGLVQAAKRVALEEQMILNFNPKGKLVN
jgi:hypothetical protein